MAPPVGRLAFTIGLSVFLLALITLPFLNPGSAEFVADVLALLLSGTFVGLVVWSVRRAAHLPMHRPSEQEEPSPVKREDGARNRPQPCLNSVGVAEG